MTRLALLAVLLLALAPSVGRVLSAGSPQVLAGWSELCTTMGLQSLPSEARSPAGFGDRGALPGSGMDCDYCPLAASLSLLLAVALLLPRLDRHARPLLPDAPRLRLALHLRGLGSRGPPLPL